MTPPRRNIELKASDPDQEGSLAVCRALGAINHGELWQRDTYFAVRNGGLKLRQEHPGKPHLIQWERPCEARARESRYRIVEVEDGETLAGALEAAVGIHTVVTKRRWLWMWDAVRIHLDTVEGLGDFIELEAVATNESDLRHEHRLIAKLREDFSIADERLVGMGYAAQLLNRAAPAPQ